MGIFIYFLVLWCSLYRIGRILFGLINCYGLFFFVKEIMMLLILIFLEIMIFNLNFYYYNYIIYI